MSSLQPRSQLPANLLAQAGRLTQVAQEYRWCGALNLFAAFNTRMKKVYGRTAGWKRYVKFITWPFAIQASKDRGSRSKSIEQR
jgi:hypothetical protein